MFTISSRKALCLAERACPHGHVVACLPSLSRAAPHSVPSRFLFLHRLPGRTRVCITAFWPHTGKLSCVQSGCWRLGAGGNRRHRAHWRCRGQPGVCCWHQCDHAGLWCLECKGTLRGCCGSESCQVVGVFTSFSPGPGAWTGQNLIQGFQWRGRQCIPAQFSP